VRDAAYWEDADFKVIFLPNTADWKLVPVLCVRSVDELTTGHFLNERRRCFDEPINFLVLKVYT
jgi:hypothetical protein